MHVEALKVISNCMEDAESMQLIQGNEGLEKLLQFIITPTDPDIQTNAVKAISRAAQSSTQAQTQTLVLLCQTSCTGGLNLRTNPRCFISCKVNDENCSELMNLL